MGLVTKLEEAEIQKIKEINAKFSELTETSSKILIEKIRLQDRIKFLEKTEAEVVSELRKTISDEDVSIATLREKYGNIENINIESGEITNS